MNITKKDKVSNSKFRNKNRNKRFKILAKSKSQNLS